MKLRIQKINELLKQEIGSLISKELDFNRDTLITITEVKTSPDLINAKVKISVLPTFKSEQVLRVINSQIFNLQKLLYAKLKMKIIPKIKFELDVSYEKFDRINQLIKKINQ